MRLSDQQRYYFRTFGFLLLRGLFTEEIERITEAFKRIWDNHGGGHGGRPHDFVQRSAIHSFIDQDEYLCSLLDDDRIDGVVADVLQDENYNYTVSDGNYFVGDSDWHSDNSFDTEYRTIKIIFYLDPLTRDNGCLRVMPGSHLFGDQFADSLRAIAPTSMDHRHEEVLGLPGQEIPCFDLETTPGDIIVFDHQLKHASYGGGGRRRMFSINFQQRYREEDLPKLREEIEKQHIFWVENAYSELMIRTATPERMRHLEQRLASIGRLPELARKARQEMSEPSRL